MRIEVTYIDTSPPTKRGVHLPKLSLPKLRKVGVNKFELRVPRVFVKVLISAVVLVVLLIVVGVLYTYFMGGGSAQPLSPVAASSDAYKPIKPTEPSRDGIVGVSLETLSSPVSPGSEASMSVHTLPGADCTIAVIYNYDYMKKQKPASNPSLGQRTADAYGTASWNWIVSPSAALGKGMATVTCKHKDQSGMVEGDIQVVSQGSATAAN